MTPGARAQAAIEALDHIARGQPAEQVLTNWARGARYAGSKDRAAVRDLVFDAVRRWRSTAALGGDDTGRARVLGLMRILGQDPQMLFSGQGHAPAPLSEEEVQAGRQPEGAEAQDLPDWLWQRFQTSLGSEAERVAQVLQERAPVALRVNTLKTTRKKAMALLEEDGISTEVLEISPTALRVTEGARAVSRSQAYTEGYVELQDGASQAVVDHLPLKSGMRVLDYCAGGGGKTLGMAARLKGDLVEAHDADARRMGDLPIRAKRAGVRVKTVVRPKGPFDLVLCDVPCSGSGSWRRAPDSKWRFQPEDLDEVCQTQAEILKTCAPLVGAGGFLAYATCSVLAEENSEQVKQFVQKTEGWSLVSERQFLPNSQSDGLYLAVMNRSDH